MSSKRRRSRRAQRLRLADNGTPRDRRAGASTTYPDEVATFPRVPWARFEELLLAGRKPLP